MAFNTEIANRLVAQGVGTLAATTANGIFIGSAATIPDGPGPFLLLKETGGSGSSKTQQGATQRPTMQLLARGKSSQAARALLVAAYNALGGADGLYNITLTGTFYVSITARQEPTDIGLDAAKRAMFSFNIDAEKAPS